MFIRFFVHAFFNAIKKIIVINTIIFSFEFPVHSQSSYRFENITSAQGISDRIINSITQDAQGFIWIASIDGLTRYDGYNAVAYHHQTNNSNSLSDDEVYALCTDDNGALWIGTRNGLNRYNAPHDKFENFLHDDADNKSLAANEIFALAKDVQGNIWVGTYNGGLDKLVKRSTGYDFIHYRYNEKDSNSISNNQVFSIAFDKEGNAWIGTSDGVNIIDASGKKILRLYNNTADKNSISNNTVNKIVAAKDGSMWLCGKNMLDNVSIIKNSNDKISVKHFLPKLIGTNNSAWAINDFLIDRYGNYWVATNDQGIFKFTADKDNIQTIEHFENDQSSFSLVNTTVFSFYEDNAGIVWIGTAKGISKYIPSKAKFSEGELYARSLSAHKQIINALLLDDKGRLWMGNDSDTLTVISNAINYSLPLTGVKNIFNQVNMIYQSKGGDVYVATFSSGLFIFPRDIKDITDRKQWIHIDKNSSSLAHNNIYAIAEDSSGVIWLGTYTGVCSYDPKTKTINNVYISPGKNVISSYIIRALLADDKNIVWCGTDEGLVQVKNNTVMHRFTSNDKDSNSLSSNRITAIYEDHNKNIWIGTKSGLNLFNASKNNFKHFSCKDDLVVETITSIEEDGNNNLWMGTNNGLIKFNITTKQFTRYTAEDGLCSNEFEPNSISRDKKNNFFYFGTANGLIAFNPSHIVSNSFVPPVIITDVKILDQPLTSFTDTTLINTYRNKKKLLLTYDQNFFSFEFAALSYTNSQANQFAYILEGVDRQWHHAGTQHIANYTDIRPGSYTFKVKASNNDGVWNNVPIAIQVIISPPWWQTWWFYTLCFIVVCTIMYIIYRIRIQQILKLYRLRSSIAKDLHDDVGSALSSIALLSNISQQAKTNAKLQPEEIFSRIGDTSKRMIDLMDDIVWSVNPDNDRFSNMLIRMREYAVEMLESKNIDFTFHIAEDIDELRIPMQMRKDYFLIFKEAINNLAKYSECSIADISIKKENKNIVTIISDNGKGFDANIINSGNGLKNMQQRAAAIKAKLNIETFINKGTTIILSMPA